MKPQPPCPECEKLAAVSEESNKIGAFLDWLTNEHYVCKWDEEYERYFAIDTTNYGINKMLAKYFDIDLDKVEDERRALLDWLREVQGG